MTGKHYLLIELNVGTVKNPVTERVYFELLSPEETIPEATGRWLESHPDMIDRQRNRDRTRERIMSQVERRQLCHPSSWYREQAEAAGLPYPAPVGSTVRRRGS